ncbi:hypothetical protein QR680_011858 [Steinernema hermaphroditum]|uniref:Uncharacterized protein n=1 Tax=Steinernema hermaphroditum TaxID=289476 RepID=A0AA39HZZ6_9BILA|nr:hypothetical protein QR680_011858 [Steinernema hermaphroditum]
MAYLNILLPVVKACILLLNIFSLFIYMRRPPQTSRFTTLAVVFVTHIVCSAASLLCYVAAILDEHYYRFFYNEEVAIVVNVTGFLADFLPIIACAIFALDRMLVFAIPLLYLPWKIGYKMTLSIVVFHIGSIIVLYSGYWLLPISLLRVGVVILNIAFPAGLFFESLMYVVFLFFLRLHHKRVSTTFSSENKQTNHIVLFQAVIHTLLSTIPNAVLYSFMFLNAEEALPGFVADLLLLSSYLSMAIISVFTLYKLVAKKMPVKVVPHTNIIPIS